MLSQRPPAPFASALCELLLKIPLLDVGTYSKDMLSEKVLRISKLPFHVFC